MLRRVLSKVGLALACFVFAGIKLKELLNGPGNYGPWELFTLGVFAILGIIYLYMAATQSRNN